MKEQIAQALSTVLKKSVPPEALQPDTNLVTVFGLNSLEMMHFILQIEESMQITIDIEAFDLDNFNRYEKLEACIRETN